MLISADDHQDVHQHFGINNRIIRVYRLASSWSGTLVDSGGGFCTGVVAGGGSLGCGEGSGTSDDCGRISVGEDASGEEAIVSVGGTSVVVCVELGSLLDAGTPFAGGTSLGCGSFTDVDEGPFASETGVSVQDQSPQHSRTPRRNSDGLCQKNNAAHHSVLAGHVD
jgi:hypothetical protein